MSLTRVSSNMIIGGGGGGGGTSVAVIVSDTTQDAIESAMAEAGNNGTVYFPAGVYEVINLTQIYSYQTWELSQNAIIRRAGGGPTLTLNAPGMRLYGGTLDGNRTVGDAYRGIDGTTNQHTMEIDDLELINVSTWGVALRGDTLRIQRLKTRNVGYAGIFFQGTSLRNYDILVEGCNIDHRTEGYAGQGGILIRCDASIAASGAFLISPVVRDNIVRFPTVTDVSQIGPGQIHENSVAIEVHHASGPVVTGNNTQYGKIGPSVNSCIGGIISGNAVSSAYMYGIEIANFGVDGTTGLTCIGNYIQDINGQPVGSPTPSQGIALSGHATNNIITANRLVSCSQGIVQNDTSTGSSITNNFVT